MAFNIVCQRAEKWAEEDRRAMMLRPGQKLHSAVCDAQLVVVRAPATEVAVGCGGFPLLDDGDAAAGEAALDASLGDGPLLGKRYADEELGLELLCTRPGQGALTVDGRLLLVKGAKPLPSSD
jgi:hypothetical protein